MNKKLLSIILGLALLSCPSPTTHAMQPCDGELTSDEIEIKRLLGDSKDFSGCDARENLGQAIENNPQLIIKLLSNEKFIAKIPDSNDTNTKFHAGYFLVVSIDFKHEELTKCMISCKPFLAKAPNLKSLSKDPTDIDMALKKNPIDMALLRAIYYEQAKIVDYLLSSKPFLAKVDAPLKALILGAMGTNQEIVELLLKTFNYSDEELEQARKKAKLKDIAELIKNWNKTHE